MNKTRVKKLEWHLFLRRLNSFPFTDTERLQMIQEVVERFNVNPKWVLVIRTKLLCKLEFKKLPLKCWPKEVQNLYRSEQAKRRKLEREYL